MVEWGLELLGSVPKNYPLLLNVSEGQKRSDPEADVTRHYFKVMFCVRVVKNVITST